MRTINANSQSLRMRSAAAAVAVAVAVPCLLVPLSSSKAQSIADIGPPPRAASVSSTGVTYGNGSFQLSQQLLSIGSGASEMSYGVHYNSATNHERGLSPPVRWSADWVAYIDKEVAERIGDNPGDYIYQLNVVVGNRTDSFQKIGWGPNGTYDYGLYRGSLLSYGGSSAQYTYTQKSGTVVLFGTDFKAQKRIEPDGTEYVYGYVNGSLASVLSNRGYGFLFEQSGTTRKVCAVSLSQSFVENGSPCPGGAPSSTQVWDSSNRLHSATNAAGQAWNFEYGGSGGYLTCFKEPGASVCKITNVWEGTGDQSSDRVVAQTFADSRTINYDYESVRNLREGDLVTGYEDISPYLNHDTWVTDATNAVTHYRFSGSIIEMQPLSVEDPLHHTTELRYSATSELLSGKLPEGNEFTSLKDDRHNITERRQKAKPTSSLPEFATTATFPATTGYLGGDPACAYPKSCNKPLTITDARGAGTNYVWSNDHGGLLSELKPAPVAGAARPLKLVSWAQKYAYIKNSGGALVPAATPVWVMTSETQCQTVAGGNTPVCDGAASQTVTSYQYGADGTADNLLVRGVVVSSGGTSLRTCYGYDALGNRISETKPRANLASCS